MRTVPAVRPILPRCAALAIAVGTTLAPLSVLAQTTVPAGGWPRATIMGAPSGMAQPGDDATVLSWVEGIGQVRATRRVTAGIGLPLPEASGRNSIVAACRDQAWSDAMPLGARSIEAASAGAERRDRSGRLTAPVRIRLVYPGAMETEVKEANITCTVDRSGRVIGGGAAAAELP